MNVMKRLFWSAVMTAHCLLSLGNSKGLLTHSKQTEGLKQDTTSRLDLFVDPITRAYRQGVAGIQRLSASNSAHSPCGDFPSSLPSADWRVYCHFILYVSVELFVEALRHQTNHTLKHSQLCVHKTL